MGSAGRFRFQYLASRENAEILRQLVELFSIQKLHHVSPDILVIKLLIEILDPKPGESVYDPASASNGMLIISYNLAYGDTLLCPEAIGGLGMGAAHACKRQR